MILTIFLHRIDSLLLKYDMKIFFSGTSFGFLIFPDFSGFSSFSGYKDFLILIKVYSAHEVGL